MKRLLKKTAGVFGGSYRRISPNMLFLSACHRPKFAQRAVSRSLDYFGVDYSTQAKKRKRHERDPTNQAFRGGGWGTVEVKSRVPGMPHALPRNFSPALVCGSNALPTPAAARIASSSQDVAVVNFYVWNHKWGNI